MSTTNTTIEFAADQRRRSWQVGAEKLPTHLHTKQIMALFGVSQNRVLAWHNDGTLEADLPPVRGSRQTYRYPRSRVIKFAQVNGLELNLEAVGIDPTEPPIS
jgi:hypothetical protein